VINALFVVVLFSLLLFAMAPLSSASPWDGDLERGKPEETDEPEEPEEPEMPDEPDEPGEPEETDEPEMPEETDEPEMPEETDEPEETEETGESEETEEPEMPEELEEPEELWLFLLVDVPAFLAEAVEAVARPAVELVGDEFCSRLALLILPSAVESEVD
jgi:outer membrane biosynthesis protein TonB